MRSGDVIEVRTEQEILSTLDAAGTLDGLPFMPEMLQFCGKQFRVFRRAEKTCDTVSTYTSRRMTNTVHLEGLRCDGGRHGGCQAGCLLFWKEAWLKSVGNGNGNGSAPRPAQLSQADLEAVTTRPDPAADHERLFVCQATELPRASTELRWWDPRPYIRELRSGNVDLGTFVRTLLTAWYNALMRLLRRPEYPHVAGTLVKTPTATLDLQPGERVRVRPLEQILATLSVARKNRGLWFDVEMVPYCAKEARVLRRVTQIVNDRTGKMMQLPGDCIILEDVVCQGCLSRNRLFCPRSIYPYWREIWLERVP